MRWTMKEETGLATRLKTEEEKEELEEEKKKKGKLVIEGKTG